MLSARTGGTLMINVYSSLAQKVAAAPLGTNVLFNRSATSTLHFPICLFHAHIVPQIPQFATCSHKQ